MTVTTRRLNMFPTKDGVSQEFSPSAIVGAQKLDCNEHLWFIHGEFEQAHLNRKTQNDMIVHTLNSIHLCPNLNPGGGHKVLNLNTSRVVAGPCLAALSMTNAV